MIKMSARGGGFVSVLSEFKGLKELKKSFAGGIYGVDGAERSEVGDIGGFYGAGKMTAVSPGNKSVEDTEDYDKIGIFEKETKKRQIGRRFRRFVRVARSGKKLSYRREPDACGRAEKA
jgi:hypothetical protein